MKIKICSENTSNVARGMKNAVRIRRPLLKWTPHSLSWPFPYACDTKVSAAPFMPSKNVKQSISLIATASPTPASLDTSFIYPANIVFISSAAR